MRVPVIRDYVTDGSIQKGANQLKSTNLQEVMNQIEIMLSTIKFGSVTLVVQDGKVIQIEKNEKVRLQSSSSIHKS